MLEAWQGVEQDEAAKWAFENWEWTNGDWNDKQGPECSLQLKSLGISWPSYVLLSFFH